MADRVNLGLIPSSREGWPIACAALKPETGGWLHVHGNVNTKDLHIASEHCDEASDVFKNTVATVSDTCYVNRDSDDISDFLGVGVSVKNCSVIATGWDLNKREDESGSSIETFGNNVKCSTGSTENEGRIKSVRKLKFWNRWASDVAKEMRSILVDLNSNRSMKDWTCTVKHIEHVKSYAPHIDHLVADIDCRPVLPT